ncbi:MAG: hypothetical protein ACR2MA_12380 [Egibacteraceae bacterium]
MVFSLVGEAIGWLLGTSLGWAIDLFLVWSSRSWTNVEKGFATLV